MTAFRFALAMLTRSQIAAWLLAVSLVTGSALPTSAAIIGLLLTGFVGAQYFLRGAFLESLELKAYDARAQPSTDLEPKTDVVIVAGDISWATRPTEVADDLAWLQAHR